MQRDISSNGPRPAKVGADDKRHADCCGSRILPEVIPWGGLFGYRVSRREGELPRSGRAPALGGFRGSEAVAQHLGRLLQLTSRTVNVLQWEDWIWESTTSLPSPTFASSFQALSTPSGRFLSSRLPTTRRSDESRCSSLTKRQPSASSQWPIGTRGVLPPSGLRACTPHEYIPIHQSDQRFS